MSAQRQEAVSGMVFNVQRSSFHDGPGIRTTVFLKGCPLRCPWCHNPESVAAAPEVLVNDERCIACGACREACPRPGGPLAAGAALGAAGCAACRRCADACPTGARAIAGQRWTDGEVLAEVLRDRLVYERSGGGVTFSGGEPLAQPEFLLACLAACRRRGLHTAVDTCGVAPREAVTAVARAADLLLWDVKLLDPRRHRELTGAALEIALANLEAAAAAGTPIWLRVPLLAGVNDDAASRAALLRLAAATPGVRRVSLLPYHAIGDGKRNRLGRESAAGFAAPPAEAVAVFAAALTAAGFETTIGG